MFSLEFCVAASAVTAGVCLGFRSAWTIEPSKKAEVLSIRLLHYILLKVENASMRLNP